MTATAKQPKAATGLSMIINRSELVDCLAACALGAKGRTPKEVLKCVRVTAGEKWVEFETTNLEVRVRRTARQLQVNATGVALVNAEDLLQAAQLADGDTVKLLVVSDALVVTGNSSHRKLYTQDVSNFPGAPIDEKELIRFKTTASAVHDAFGYIRHAVGEETRHYAYQAFTLERDGDRTMLAGMDGHRLAVKPMAGECGGELPGVIIHADNFSTATRAVGGEGDDEFVISVAESSILVECGDAECWMVRLQGTLPIWRDVIKIESDGGVKVAREPLLTAVMQASAAMSEEAKAMVVEASKGGLKLSMRSQFRGESAANLPCRVEGKETKFAVNARSLLDCLGAMVGDEVEWSWNDPGRPFSLKCGDETEIMMPVNMPA